MVKLFTAPDGARIMSLCSSNLGGFTVTVGYPLDSEQLIAERRIGELVQGEHSSLTGNSSVEHFKLDGDFYGMPSAGLADGYEILDKNPIWQLTTPGVLSRRATPTLSFEISSQFKPNNGLCATILEYYEAVVSTYQRVVDKYGRPIQFIIGTDNDYGYRTSYRLQAWSKIIKLSSSSSVCHPNLLVQTYEEFGHHDNGVSGRFGKTLSATAMLAMPYFDGTRCIFSYVTLNAYRDLWDNNPSAHTFLERCMSKSRELMAEFYRTHQPCKRSYLARFRTVCTIDHFVHTGDVGSFFESIVSAYREIVSIPGSDTTWGNLTLEAIKSCKYSNANIVAFAKDLPETLGEVRALAACLKDPENPKNWASLFLSGKYGTRLTIADLKDIMSGISRRRSELRTWTKSYNIVRSRSIERFEWQFGDIDRSLNYRIYYNPYDNRFLKFIKKLMDWDVWIDFQNAWDLIPFSFVVDWVVNVEDFLEEYDAINYSYYLSVLEVLRTYKDQIAVGSAPELYGLTSADATLTYYNREVTRSLDLPVPQIGLEKPDLTHLPELGSIIIQLFG